MESFRCAGCGNTLSIPVRLVALPAGLRRSFLDHYLVNPPRLEPGTYAIDAEPHGRDRITGTFVLSPGDARGMRFVHDLVDIGCWSLVGWTPCLACEGCGALVASRMDDCGAAQETRLLPSMVVLEDHGDGPGPAGDPFARVADWDRDADDGGRLARRSGAARPRPELVATRWGCRGLRDELFRDDPPA